jgi:hypothetical protein
MIDPVELLLSIAGVIACITSAIAVLWPDMLSRKPEALRPLRPIFLWIIAASAVVLAALWSGGSRSVGFVMIAVVFLGAFVLPRTRVEWRPTIAVLAGSLALGGGCWFGVVELLALGGVVVPVPTLGGLAIALVLGAFLQHRYAEVWAFVSQA